MSCVLLAVLGTAQVVGIRRMTSFMSSHLVCACACCALIPASPTFQVEEGKLARLQEASTAKAGRLESARARLQELQDKLTSAQMELKELQGTAAHKSKQTHAASTEQRKIG